ncbi:MAG: DinB family protein, partial [Eudoraea sp.]|nr:DinB family protein [Eudoraea sp.]
MNNLFKNTLQNRKIFYRILKHTPMEQLLKIPDGFRNNVFWNIGHVVVTQQLLTYDRSSLSMKIPDNMVERFRKGSVPDGRMTQQEKDQLSTYVFSTIERTEEDYRAGVFKSYRKFTTATNAEIASVDDALIFNLFHEGLH